MAMDKFKSIGDLIFPTGQERLGLGDWSALNQLEKNLPALTFISDTNPDFAFLYFSSNKPVFSKFGFPRPMAYKDVLARVHKLDRETASNSFASCRQFGKSTVCYRARDINDNYHWLLDNKVLAKDENNEQRIFGVITPMPLDDNSFIEPLKQALAVNTSRQAVEERFAAQLTTPAVGCTVCMLDIDKFTVINSSYGYATGDILLRETTDFIRANLDGFRFCEHYQEDKFLLIFDEIDEKNVVARLRRFQQTLKDFRFQWDGKQHIITLSMGIVPVGMQTQPDHVINMALLASSFAKESGRSGIHVHAKHNSIMDERKEEMLWVEKINTAIDENRFVLYYQPILPLDDQSGETHFELLVRMKDDHDEIIAPGSFLPAVERYNLAGVLDQWVIQTAFSWLATNSELLDRDFCWGINLSGKSLSDREMLPFVIKQLQEKGIPPEKIYFEITETAAIANISKAGTFIRKLQKLGCKFALDDFGSGLSSFSYLKNLPVNYLKIDGQFIRNIVHDQADHMIVSSINSIARSLKIRTIAEFVENDEIRDVLRNLGINYAQGFGIARPAPLLTFSETYQTAGRSRT